MWKECTICDTYLVSDEGEVKNKYTGKILKQKLDKNNALIVHLSLGKRDKSIHCIVARLVAEAFIPNPNNLPWVKHVDGNIINNEANNLMWTDSKWSLQSHGDDVCNAKLTQEQVQYCRKVYKARDKQYGIRPLAEKFNVGVSTMWYAINGITYK